MLVVLEGPDGSGKTTLADALEELLLRAAPTCCVKRVKSGPPTRHPLEEYLRSLWKYRPGGNYHWILDRWHWGEYVYPLARGRTSQLDPPAWWSIEAYLRRLGAVVVRCAQYPDRYRQVFRDRGESESQADELPLVDKLFREARGMSHLPVVDFNWESSVNGDVFRVVDAARIAEVEASQFNDFRTYLGPPRPDVLLLGDVRHKLRFDDDENYEYRFDPAFVPFPGTSGHYLLNALGQTRWPGGRTLGIANACDVDDPVALWNVLGRPSVVTLGRNSERAWRRLTDSGLGGTSTVPHPQYVRRFHHSMQAGYGTLIWATAAYGGDNGSWPLSSKQSPAGRRTSRSSSASAATAASAPVVTAT